MSIEKDINKRYEHLVNEIIQYEKTYHTYEFNDCYDTSEEAINDINYCLKESDGIDNLIANFGEDIILMAIEKGMSDNEIKKCSDSAYKLIEELSKYKEYLNKNKEHDMNL